MIKPVVVVSTALFLVGCQLPIILPIASQPAPVEQADSQTESQNQSQAKSQPQSSYLSDQGPLPINPTYIPVTVPLNAQGDPLSHAASLMAEQLAQGLSEARVQRLPMTVLPFGPIPGQRSYERLGEQASEAMFYFLQANQYNLIDYRVAGMPDRALPDVDSESLSNLRRRNRIYFVLTGNYGRYNDGIVLNSRVLDTTTRQVVGAGQVHIPDALLEGGTPGYDPLRAMERGMIIETQRGPMGLE